MNYNDTLDKIHEFRIFGSRLGLERISVLMDLLGNPQDNMKIIHVAGTNGKGSVCRYLASVLQENGYRTGLYTSPYLERFEECMEFDGREISEEDLISCAKEAFQAVNLMMAQGYESPTEFELITAIAFIYFNRMPMDILILEVGLGGRRDFTNIIRNPLVSVITSVSNDHLNVLGATLPEIAREKSGIIKAGSPVISNVEDAEAAKVIRERAREMGCLFYDAGEIKPAGVRKSLEGYSFTIGEEAFGESLRVELRMIGMHQISNAICALAVIEILSKRGIITVKIEKIQRGLKNAFQKGRFEIVQNSPWVIMDGAHNIAGVEAFTRVVRDHFHGYKALMIIGMLAEKDINSMVSELCTIQADIIATEPDSPGKLDAEILCKTVRREGRKCTTIKDREEALGYICREMHKYDVILITGSLYLISRMRGRFTG